MSILRRAGKWYIGKQKQKLRRIKKAGSWYLKRQERRYRRQAAIYRKRSQRVRRIRRIFE